MQSRRQRKTLTLYAEAELLLLVGDVAAHRTDQGHGQPTDDPSNRPGLYQGTCKKKN